MRSILLLSYNKRFVQAVPHAWRPDIENKPAQGRERERAGGCLLTKLTECWWLIEGDLMRVVCHACAAKSGVSTYWEKIWKAQRPLVCPMASAAASSSGHGRMGIVMARPPPRHTTGNNAGPCYRKKLQDPDIVGTMARPTILHTFFPPSFRT